MTKSVRNILQWLNDNPEEIFLKNDPILSSLKNTLEKSIKFIFDPNSLVESYNDLSKVQMIPPTKDEITIIRENKIPFPGYFNWFEFTIPNTKYNIPVTNGYIVIPILSYKNNEFELINCDVSPKKYNKICALRISYVEDLKIVIPSSSVMIHIDKSTDTSVDFEMFDKNYIYPKDTVSKTKVIDSYIAIFVMLTRIYSRTVEVDHNIPSKKLVKNQLRRGRIPSQPYNVVRLHTTIRKYLSSTDNTESDIKIRKRLHFVRSHLRTLKSGVTIPIIAHWRGIGNLGVVNKYYELLDK